MSRVSETPSRSLAVERRSPPGRRTLRPGSERGQSLTELALVVPFLLLLVFGILEVSRLLETQHTMSALTREGANLASRGTSMDLTLEATRENQEASGLGTGGGVIVSRIRVEDEVPEVERQVSTTGYESRVGAEGEVATPYQDAGLLDGKTYFVVEIFVPYQSFTPFGNLINGIVPETLYDRTLF